MPRKMTPARVRDLLLSLLLGMALALSWPSMGKLPPRSGPAAPHAAAGAEAAATSFAATRHSHGAAHDHHRTLPEAAADSAPDSAPGAAPECVPDTGCCVMTQCHPGLAWSLPGLPGTAPLRAQGPDAPTGAAGVDPAILVPPPRLVFV